MTQEEIRAYCSKESIPDRDIECIIDWVYRSDEINRLSMSEIAEAYGASELTVLEANVRRAEVPHHIESTLRESCGEGVDYGVEGIYYVLAKT
jgi:hypothetical protein